MFTFRDMFMGKLDGFETIIERVGQAGWIHWVFTMLFAIGLVALLTKDSGMSKTQGAGWLFASISSTSCLILPSIHVSSVRCSQ